MVEMQFGINVKFFRRVAKVSDVFQGDGEFIPDPRPSDREKTFAQVKCSFRKNKL